MNRLAEIRKQYNLTVQRGDSVLVYNADGSRCVTGTITGADHHGRLLIRLEGNSEAWPYHPRDTRLRYGLGTPR